MVCASEENLAFCVIQDAKNSGSVKDQFHFPASSTVSELYEEVGRRIQCHQDSFDLMLQRNQNENPVHLSHRKAETMEVAGFQVGPDSKNNLVVVSSSGMDLSKACDLRVGASGRTSASGDFGTPAVPCPPPPPPASTLSSGDCSCSTAIVRQEIGYVGLVNQAMTCYLNSLLQALYMTPEFRNAMYNWEFDGSPSEEAKSIPYQLQKLFLNLQTSRKFAVETTELTRSFGWDSWEAWQQHDIQELCRVMFDTLEQKFKNTKQADLINRLYEGKMIDYVKCLECSTEKSREDTFLDIPLPVRPFGSNVAYGSVEEALRAFVQPETLEGNNQYHCDKCNKKCDAHKGLKFTKFPYLLTLHLKRFDFDFNTLHRIKLNDKVSFPENLNLNSFIAHEKKGNEMSNSEASPDEAAVKCDDSCTTDSGSALDDEVCQGMENSNVPNSHENHTNDYQDDDEGIDVGQQHENEKNRQIASETGPYVYELFSIMIHSGSAAGGHYYAYIKDFKDGQWYCFNDQNVSRITYDDIRKTYGGGPIKGYYSGAYSSSTNAYMLMYRQIDKERNASSVTVEEFPEHIKLLHKKLEEQKELDSIVKNIDFDTCKIRIYCNYPNQNGISEAKVYVDNESTLKETVQIAYKRLYLEKVVPIDRCRLVSYDELRKAIDCSFEGKEEVTIGDICLNHGNDFLMDIREEGEEFEVYKLGDINTIVTVFNVETEEVRSPTVVRANLSNTVKEYKEIIRKQLKLPGQLLLVEKFHHRKPLQNEEFTLRHENFYYNIKVYAAGFLTDEEMEFQRHLILRKLNKMVCRFKHVITLRLVLPDIDNEALERLKIPPLDQSKVFSLNKLATSEDSMLSLRGRGGDSPPNRRDSSPQPLPDPEDECAGPTGPQSDQSASEDSSLTDSERTIVGEVFCDCFAQLSPNSSPAGSDQNVSSSFEAEAGDCMSKRIGGDRHGGKLARGLHRNEESENWDVDDLEISSRTFNYFFKAVSYNENQKELKVLVDKRMLQKSFKQCLEPFVGVPVDHFKILKTCIKHSDLDYSALPDTLDIYKDNEKLTVKLERALKAGEYLGNVFLLATNSDEPVKHLFEWVIAKNSPVTQVKREIVDELKRKCAIEIPVNRCRLRKKSWKVPTRIYLDGTNFDDLTGNWELFVQKLPGEDPVTSPNQTVLLLRQLGVFQVKPLEEIVLDTNTVAEFREKLSEASEIPAEFIEMVKAPGAPCLDLSALTSYIDVEWNTFAMLSDLSLTMYGEGYVIFYRDSRDKSKSCLLRDRKLLKDRRNRLYSPIKERALKIYLDATPSRKDESDVD